MFAHGGDEPGDHRIHSGRQHGIAVAYSAIAK